MNILRKVISGGQTGVDQAALRAARDCGLEIGGWCPPGRLCEAGLIPPEFPLKETPNDRSPEAPDLPRSQRTEWNVHDADGTLVILLTEERDAGTKWTVECAKRYERLLLLCNVDNPEAAAKICQWLRDNTIETLNVAGPSEATAPGVGKHTYTLLRDVFEDLLGIAMPRLPVNTYSTHWFEFFHAGIAEGRTRKETNFICACAPLPEFRRVLDVCCGMGRHARALANRGYSVTGVERDLLAIQKARELNDGPEYVQADVRDYEPEIGAYDLAIIMSQSFGYFDASTNRDLLGRIANGLRKGGRVILDLWNPDFFLAHQGAHDLDTPAGIVREAKRVKDGRLLVHLTYANSAEEDFEWQLFTPEEMALFAQSEELALVVACTDFDAAKKPHSTNPRIEFVLQKS